MKTYKLSCLLAITSAAAAIKWSIPQNKGLFEDCSSDVECESGLECRFPEIIDGLDFIFDLHPANKCQPYRFGQEGDPCMEPWLPLCEVGLECREQMTQNGDYTCQ